jgi:Rrf2 family iron-sulfur cluster assembly transcriptional regulator
MRLTTKGRFAVTAMVDLAMRGDHNPVTLAGISERQKISLSYLEQLFGKLRRNNIVSSVRGPGGGYRLARPAEQIAISEIILAVDEPLDATSCAGKGDCLDGNACITHELWQGLTKTIYAYLAEVNLQEMVDAQKKDKDQPDSVNVKLSANMSNSGAVVS